MSRLTRVSAAVATVALLAGCGSSGSQDAPQVTDPDITDASTPEDTQDTDDGSFESSDNDSGSDETNPGSDTGQDNPPGDEACPEDQNGDPSDASEGDADMAEPTAGSCEQPGPDEDAGDALSINVVQLGPADGAQAITAHIEISNNSDQAQHVIAPTSVRPRVDELDGVDRLSYLRANFTGDGSRVDVDALGDPHEVTIAAGETLTIDEPLPVDADQITQSMRVCVEVRDTAPEGSPAAEAPTGDERSLLPNDIGFGPGSTVPLICSEPADIEPV